MADPAEKPWTVDAFFARRERQPERRGLVGATPLRTTIGVRILHDGVVVDIVAEPRRGAPVARVLRRRGLSAAAPPPKAARRRLELSPLASARGTSPVPPTL